MLLGASLYGCLFFWTPPWRHLTIHEARPRATPALGGFTMSVPLGIVTSAITGFTPRFCTFYWWSFTDAFLLMFSSASAATWYSGWFSTVCRDYDFASVATFCSMSDAKKPPARAVRTSCNIQHLLRALCLYTKCGYCTWNFQLATASFNKVFGKLELAVLPPTFTGWALKSLAGFPVHSFWSKHVYVKLHCLMIYIIWL